MASIISDIAIDRSNDIWITGTDVIKFDGSSFQTYDFSNSAVPTNQPYYLDTRTISIDTKGDKWIGCATAPYVSDVGIFHLKGEYAQEAETWTYQEIGVTGDYLETSKIYASPYGNEVLAFITDLNGGVGITGSTGPLGVTGGYLYKYDQNLSKWSEILTGFNWSHTYDIKAKGIDGNKYEYWIATEIGIIIFDGGEGLIESTLLDSGNTIESSRILNTENSGLPSSVIYSLDFDIDNNLWLGTANGLCFLSSTGECTVWNSPAISLPSYHITVVKSVNNGQVFFASGNGQNQEGNGLYYFNGDTLISYTTSNSSIPNNNVTEIVSFWRKSKNNQTVYYPDEILISCYNDFALVNYITPHVYASAKMVGPTGWNFVYYTPSDGIELPKVDKYSWEYPSWRTEQDLYLEFAHPGLDRRNLFLSAALSDIADGSAGEREYWNNGPVPLYDDYKKTYLVPENTWMAGLTGSSDISASTDISVTTLGDLYVAAFSITPTGTISIGQKPDGTEIIITNPNSTTGSPANSNLGVIAYYNKKGQIEGYNTIRGNSTFIYDIKSSPDQDSLYVLGGYKNLIEAGEFVYGMYPGGASGGGPTGSAIGISNINSPNIQGATGDYPWILSDYAGGTASPYIATWYDSGATGTMGLFIMEIDHNIGSETSYGGIDLSDQYEARNKYFLKDFRHFPTNVTLPEDIVNASIEITRRNINISANISGVNALLYTYSGEYSGRSDSLGISKEIGTDKGTLDSMNVHLILDRELNVKNTQYTNNGQGPGTSVLGINISTETSNETVLLTGTASDTSFYFGDIEIGAGITAGDYGYYILLDSSGSYISSEVSLDILDREGLASSSGRDRHYIFYAVTGPTSSVFTEESGFIETEYGSVVLTVAPAGGREVIGSYDIEFNGESSIFKVNKASISAGNTYSTYYGLTGGNDKRLLLKTDIIGGNANYYSFGATGFGVESMDYQTSQDGDLFFAGTNTDGGNGPLRLPVPEEYELFVGLSLTPKVKTGKAMGSIISKAGTNPWKWGDVHRDTKNMTVPLMSTVFFSNYDSNIFGKENYRWVLTNQKTGEELLDIKSSPYFIYTFNEDGYFTLYNSIEDSKGNVYEISKPAYINVINHRAVKQEDNEPGKVNSYDYGYPQKSTTRSDDFYRLGKELDMDSKLIEKETRPQFGSGVVIKDNPDATFRED